jgi:chemotaxis protein CheY-P-specific phosphatase CheC
MSEIDPLMSKNEFLHQAILGEVDNIVTNVVQLKDDLKKTVDVMLTSLALNTQKQIEASGKLQDFFSNAQSLAEAQLNLIVQEIVKKHTEAIKSTSNQCISHMASTISTDLVQRTTQGIADVTHTLQREVKGMHEHVLDATKEVKWSWEKRLSYFGITLVISLALGLFIGQQLEARFPAAYSKEVKRIMSNGEFFEAFWPELSKVEQERIRKLVYSD